jgi:hypothetical protein
MEKSSGFGYVACAPFACCLLEFVGSVNVFILGAWTLCLIHYMNILHHTTAGALRHHTLLFFLGLMSSLRFDAMLQ